MPWKKSPEKLKAVFESALPADGRVERRQMFGYPSAFVHGHLFTGLHEERLIVRLDQAGRAELLGMQGATIFEPMKGRPMKEYVVVPARFHYDLDTLRKWTARALSYAATLPPKAARKPKARRPR